MVQKLIDEVAKMRKERYEKDRQIEKQKRADREEARKKQLAEEVTEIDPEILMRGPMYPVEEEIKELLYKGPYSSTHSKKIKRPTNCGRSTQYNLFRRISLTTLRY